MINKLTSLTENPIAKRVIENILSLGALKAVAMLLPLILIPHLIGTVGMTSIGLLALAASISQYFGTLMDYGFAYTGAREVASNELDKSKNTNTFFTIIYCQITLIVFSLSILLALSLISTFIYSNFKLILLSLIYVSLISLSPSWFFQGVQDMKKIAIGEVIGKIISFILIIYFVKDTKDLILVPTFYIIGQSFCLVVYSIFLKNYITLDFPSFNLRSLLIQLKESWSMFVYILFPNFYNNYSYLAVGYFSDLSSVAAYDIIRKVMNISEQAIGIISRVFYPLLTNNFKYFSNFLKIIGFVALILTSVQLLVGYFGIDFLLGKGANISYDLLILQGFAPIVFAAWMAYGINNLGVRGMDSDIRNITIYCSILGFVLVTILTYYFAAFGALMGVLLTILLKAILFYHKSKKQITYSYNS